MKLAPSPEESLVVDENMRVRIELVRFVVEDENGASDNHETFKLDVIKLFVERMYVRMTFSNSDSDILRFIIRKY